VSPRRSRCSPPAAHWISPYDRLSLPSRSGSYR
jgi:hypothetical protein